MFPELLQLCVEGLSCNELAGCGVRVQLNALSAAYPGHHR